MTREESSGQKERWSVEPRRDDQWAGDMISDQRRDDQWEVGKISGQRREMDRRTDRRGEMTNGQKER